MLRKDIDISNVIQCLCAVCEWVGACVLVCARTCVCIYILLISSLEDWCSSRQYFFFSSHLLFAGSSPICLLLFRWPTTVSNACHEFTGNSFHILSRYKSDMTPCSFPPLVNVWWHVRRESRIMQEMEEGKTDIVRVRWSECLEVLERSSQLYWQTGLPKSEWV